MEFQTQSMEIDDKDIKAQIWDTAGQERFRAVTSTYYRGALGALVVFDITRRPTFENVARWLQELKMHSNMNVVTMLVGNKWDLEKLREVPIEESKAFAKAEKFFLMETSALNATNVNDSFQIVIREIYNNMSRNVLSNSYKSEFPLGSSNRVTLIGNGDDEMLKGLKKYACC